MGAFQEGISALWIYGLGCHKDNALECVGRLGETRGRKVFNTSDSLRCQKKIVSAGHPTSMYLSSLDVTLVLQTDTKNRLRKATCDRPLCKR